MCGGDYLPAEFDLEEFCEVLQGKVCDIEIVPAHDPSSAVNRGPELISAHLFEETLGEYCPK